MFKLRGVSYDFWKKRVRERGRGGKKRRRGEGEEEEGRKEGGKEGRREGGKEGRKEGRDHNLICSFNKGNNPPLLPSEDFNAPPPNTPLTVIDDAVVVLVGVNIKLAYPSSPEAERDRTLGSSLSCEEVNNPPPRPLLMCS